MKPIEIGRRAVIVEAIALMLAAFVWGLSVGMDARGFADRAQIKAANAQRDAVLDGCPDPPVPHHFVAFLGGGK
jgi:hypothetical protein